MRKTTKLIVAAAAALAPALTLAPPAALAAKPRLDKSFGLHHGYWVRADGPWASPSFVAAPAGGSVLVAGADARFARIGADGKPDNAWGTGGTVDAAEGARGGDPSRAYAYAAGAARWNGRYLLLAGATSGQTARVVDARGRVLPEPTAAVRATFPTAAMNSGSTYYTELLAPAPDGRLWDLRSTTRYTSTYQPIYETSLSALDAAGAPLVGTRINLVNLSGVLSGAFATANGLVVFTRDGRTGRLTVQRLRTDGSFDNGFSRTSLPEGGLVIQALPWCGGLVVVTAGGNVSWISDTGRIVRRRKVAAGTHLAFDTAWRLVAVSSHLSHHFVTVRRLRSDGRLDKAFGTVRLRAAGRMVDALGVVAAPGGRLLVVGSSLTENPAAIRDDFLIPHATVVWRLRTR